MKVQARHFSTGIRLLIAWTVIYSLGWSDGEVCAAQTPASPTFTEHVAPIVFQNCVSCHRAGEAGPFPLITYEDVRKHARQIAEVTEKKFMPPWHAETGHLEFQNARVLTTDEVATLRRWYEKGMPEGNRAKLPKLPVFTEGWQLGKPDLILKMDQPF